jgi:hypothetical protein
MRMAQGVLGSQMPVGEYTDRPAPRRVGVNFALRLPGACRLIPAKIAVDDISRLDGSIDL